MAERTELIGCAESESKARQTNNMVERVHGTLKDRLRPARGLKHDATAKKWLDGYVVNYNFVKPHIALEGKTPAEAAGIEAKADSGRPDSRRDKSEDKTRNSGSNGGSSGVKRALVSLPDELFDLMRTKLKGKFGQNDSEIIRGIVIAYLSEQGYLKNNEAPDEERSEIQEDMIGAIVETLEEKGLASSKDIDNKVRTNSKRRDTLQKWRS